jgi:hypothetical protein
MDNDRSFEASFEFLWEGEDLLLGQVLIFLVLAFFLLVVFIGFNGLTGFVLKIKSLRKIEVQLNSSQLMKSSKAVFNLNINLGSIKGSIPGIEFPGSVHLFQDIFELLLGRVPKLNISNELLGSSGKL